MKYDTCVATAVMNVRCGVLFLKALERVQNKALKQALYIVLTHLTNLTAKLMPNTN